MTLKLFHTFAYIIYSSVLPLESLEVNFYSSLCSSYFQVDTWTDKNKSGVTSITRYHGGNTHKLLVEFTFLSALIVNL